jgi:hypothetical protein
MNDGWMMDGWMDVESMVDEWWMKDVYIIVNQVSMNNGRIMNQCLIKYGWMMDDGWKIDGLWINGGWMMD